ncbi:MAG: septation protein A [Hyphomicrobiales bacterium]|nr:septation protein A [Hyphomicrobiales bacterium]MDE2018421.1 septation protein A [Hyphomicrobiales bacterium]
MTDAARSPQLNPVLKLALELGPLGLFFVANARWGIFPATAVLMAGTALSLALSWAKLGRVPVMPLVTGAAVLVMGGLTLLLHDELFIKMKPTIVDCLFGAALLGGLAFGKPLLPVVLDAVFKLTDEGWRKLTFRWGLFFFALAAANEAVWRTQTTSTWAAFKLFGVMPITIAFALAQTPLILRHEDKSGGGGAAF